MHRGWMVVSVVSGLIAVAIFILVIVGYASTPRRVATGPEPRPTFAQPVDAEVDYHPANNPVPVRSATPGGTTETTAPSAQTAAAAGTLTTAAPAPTDNNPYTVGR